MVVEKVADYRIFFYDEKYADFLRVVAENRFKVIKEYKNTQRNYVVLVEYGKDSYVLKSPRNEFRIPQRKILTLLKHGEAVSTLKNINRLFEKGFQGFALPVGAVVKRKCGMISESHLIFEVAHGKSAVINRDVAVEATKKMHQYGVYHGDCNPSNFIITETGVKIIDTQAKKMWLGNYRAHYDMLTMKMDSYEDMEYPYNKNFWYFMALFVKKLKRNKIIAKIKKNKKILRDKGWKI